nr:NADH dehydrogenase subunit 6 [Pyrota palpalis]
MTLLIMNIIFSVIFTSLTHPLSLGLILLVQTTIISLVTGSLCINFWFSYILYLIMVGGMLILFIYMTSIASNEKFSFSIKALAPTIVIPCIMLPTMMYFTYDSSIKNDMMVFKLNNLAISMSKYTLMPANMILAFMIIYLFITLIAIVKIVDTKNGPLRAKN